MIAVYAMVYWAANTTRYRTLQNEAVKFQHEVNSSLNPFPRELAVRLKMIVAAGQTIHCGVEALLSWPSGGFVYFRHRVAHAYTLGSIF
jgi:hypothetical protein